MVEGGALARSAMLLTALACLTAGALLALQHPVAPAAAVALFVLAALVMAWRPGGWLFVVPAALPMLNFAPWTGGLVVEEFDLLVLAAAGGAHARTALSRVAGRASPLHSSFVWKAFAGAALLFGLVSTVSLGRGVAAAGGLGFGWFQGYTEPLNSWRVFKSLVGVALLWPLLRCQIRIDAPSAVRALVNGMLVGVAIVGSIVVWERAAYPGAFNFSSPYRATALFWEMHVGGAAIDAYLALATPFVAWALWSAQSRLRWCMAAVLALLTGYACLTTFARGLYFAVAVPLTLLGVVIATRRAGDRVHALVLRTLAIGAALLAAAAALTFAFAFEEWGHAGLGLMLLCAAGVGWAAGWRLRPIRRRSVAAMMLVLALLLEVAAVLGLGTFMRERIAASEDDLGGRLVHWHNGIGLLRGAPDWWWGIGTGRLPAEYAARVPRGEFPGDVRFVPGAPSQGSVMVLGPKTREDIRGSLALTQRVELHAGRPHRVELDVHVERAATVLIQVCEMHLLYPRECQRALLRLMPEVPRWRHLAVNLRGPSLAIGESAWQRAAVFSVAVLNPGGAAEFDNVSLLDPASRELLANRDFSQGMVHWLPVAQSYFLPWHIDNFYLELLIERGLPGCLALCACLAIAIACLLGRSGRTTPVAPFLAASLCGALCVGVVSSLMDVPRVAFLLLLLVVFSVELTGSRQAPGGL